MSFGDKIPHHEEYEELKDTPYITSLRDLSQRGYEGYRDNYNKVNVFSPETQRSLDDYTNAVYQRAEGDFDRQYRDTMKRMANRNYGQFGTLNATPALYRTDMENLAQQRKLADMAYNKALYRESLVDNELRRRYNTLNMYNEMLDKGKTPYELDLKNWEIRNKNKDVRFGNAEIDANAGGGFKGALKGALQGAAAGLLASKLPIGGSGGGKGLLSGGPWGALAGAVAGGFLGAQKKYVPSSVFSTTRAPEDLGYFGGNVGDYVGGLFTALGKGNTIPSTTSSGNGGSLFDILLQQTGGNTQLPSTIYDDIYTPTTTTPLDNYSLSSVLNSYLGGGLGMPTTINFGR